MKIANRKRYWNAVDGVILAAIQIAVDPIKCRTDGTSVFNTRAAQGRLPHLDLARRRERLGKTTPTAARRRGGGGPAWQLRQYFNKDYGGGGGGEGLPEGD